MSYARRTATKRTPAMQAALDKRAALMLRVHEARMEGALSEADVETVESTNLLRQHMETAVVRLNHSPDNENMNLINPDIISSNFLCYVSSSFKEMPSPSYLAASIIGSVDSDSDVPKLWLSPLQYSGYRCLPCNANLTHHRPGYSPARMIFPDEETSNRNVTNSRDHVNNFENVDIEPNPLSTTTVPNTYFGTNKQHR
ncbi:hypothetical protein [Morganella morganii]|uniref:hypothetical protein n=1 Tax=Morganella morganii TaxID=582 RepID=UPI000B2EDA79|nr:hypothetical protein [Morganella morganii]HCR4033257.1 hypothetical protein [Morganella morganii]